MSTYSVLNKCFTFCFEMNKQKWKLVSEMVVKTRQAKLKSRLVTILLSDILLRDLLQRKQHFPFDGF